MFGSCARRSRKNTRDGVTVEQTMTSDGLLLNVVTPASRNYDCLLVLTSPNHPTAVVRIPKTERRIQEVLECTALFNWQLLRANSISNTSNEVTLHIYDATSVIALWSTSTRTQDVLLNLDPTCFGNAELEQTSFFVPAEAQDHFLCIITPQNPSSPILVNSIQWNYTNASEPSDKEEESESDVDDRLLFSERYHIFENYNILLDKPQFKAILISDQASAVTIEFEIDPLEKKAMVYAYHTWGTDIFFQPCIQAKPFCNAKLTSLRFSDRCGCQIANPLKRVLIAKMIPDNPSETFCFFLRLRATVASDWNIRNTRKLEQLWNSGEEFLAPHLRSNALYMDNYVYEKMEYSNGVSIAFREKDQCTHEMYCDNHCDKAIKLEFGFWSEHTIVTPHYNNDPTGVTIVDWIPAHTRVRLVEIRTAGDGKFWKWNHNWKWFRLDYENQKRINLLWDRFCYLHPAGHAGVSPSILRPHLDLCREKTQDTWFSVDGGLDHLLDKSGDWIPFTNFLEMCDSKESYSLTDFLLYSREEIQRSFRNSLLDANSQHGEKLWTIIFDFFPTRRRFLWPVEDIKKTFKNTWLGIDEADHCWFVILNFLGW